MSASTLIFLLQTLASYVFPIDNVVIAINNSTLLGQAGQLQMHTQLNGKKYLLTSHYKICVCVRTCVYAYMHVCTHVHTCTYARTHTHTHTRICMCLHTRIYMCMYVLHQPKDLLVADQSEKHSSNPITPNAYKPCNSTAPHVALSL